MNLFENIPEELADEIFDDLVTTPAFRLERIISRGHVSPAGGDGWYDQERHEWVMVVRGHARLRFEEGNRLLEMRAGDHVVIRAGEKHRVEWTDPEQETVWLALHYGD